MHCVTMLLAWFDCNSTLTLSFAVADYTCQALVSSLLFSHFPQDQIVGEEDSSELNTPANAETKTQIMRLAQEAMSESLPIEQDEAAWSEVKSVKERSEKDWLDIIDRGNSTGGAQGRHWALDPIDGTKGFLRGGQYAVCLGLLVDGQVQVGVMGCPNLPLDPSKPDGEKGAVFVAVKGEGAFQVRSGGSLSSRSYMLMTQSHSNPSNRQR